MAAMVVGSVGCGLVSGLDNLEVGDASVDAISEATPDVVVIQDVFAPDVDATNPGDADASNDVGRSVKCGAMTCSGTTPYCCENGALRTCIGAITACNGVLIHCDSPADCDPGQICCGTGVLDGSCVVGTSVSCQNTCSAQLEFIVCDDASDCAQNQTCGQSVCTLPGYGVCK